MNKKGFAATGILYTILVLFILLIFSLLTMLYSRNSLLNKIQNEIKGNLTSTIYNAYTNGTVVYFNPETATICSPANSVSTTGTKTGCMKWYIFNDNSKNGYVSMILDHNTTATVAWNSTWSNSEMKEVAAALTSDTSTWKSELNARLIEANEVAQITGAAEALSWSSDKTYATTPTIGTSISYFYLDGAAGTDATWHTQIATSEGASKYTWLYDNTYGCTSYGCNVSDDKKYEYGTSGSTSNVYGYWTSNSVIGNSYSAWRVNRNGYLSDHTVGNFNYNGVRPVITVNKNLISTNTTNLVTNGDLALKNNTNFASFTYGEDSDGGYVSYSGNTAVILGANEFIPVDTSKKYKLTMDLKRNSITSTHLVGLIECDIDKKAIDGPTISYIAGSLTSLAKDLKKGDTVVYLNNVSGFKVTSTTPAYQRGFIFWNYQDSTGYTYPEQTYSRNYFHDLFEYGSIDTTNNTITLKKAWTGNTISAGTKLSQSSSKNIYNYSVAMGALSTNWATYSAEITGISYSLDNYNDKFRPATKYVKPLFWFNNNGVTGATLYIKNVSLVEVK